MLALNSTWETKVKWDGEHFAKAPIHDPRDAHLHIWRRGCHIEGLVTEQDPHQDTIVPMGKGRPAKRRDLYCARCWKHRPRQTELPRCPKVVKVQFDIGSPPKRAFSYGPEDFESTLGDIPDPLGSEEYLEEVSRREGVISCYVDRSVGSVQRDCAASFIYNAPSDDFDKALFLLKTFGLTKLDQDLERYTSFLETMDLETRQKLKYDLDAPQRHLNRALREMLTPKKKPAPPRTLWRDREIPHWMHPFVDAPEGHIAIRRAKNENSRRTMLLPITTLKEILAKTRI